VALATALAAVALVTACEIERVDIPQPPSQLALHAVLSASSTSQAVLLERTRTGSEELIGGAVDSRDPIVSARGIPESRAIVRLITPAGDTLFGREDNTISGDGKGAGVYRFPIDGAALQGGQTYRLSVQTLTGEHLTAETSMPLAAPVLSAAQRVLDRSLDTAILQWSAVPGARSYFVRVESPFGPRFFFTESTHVRLPGTLRNTQATGLPRLFFPGFQQWATVSAVDSNFYDWYRSHNNSISGEGLISRVNGGIGVFGSLVRVVFESIDVTAPQSEPIAGAFHLIGSDDERAGAPYLSLTLWLESRASRGDQPDAVSGRYFKQPRIGDVGCQVCGVLGTVHDGHVELALLQDWFAYDTADVFVGELHGDTLIGHYRTLAARFLKDAP
jgi:hypothetical protein